MKLYIRAGMYWLDLRVWDASTGTRKRIQRSTGVAADGTKSNRDLAKINAERMAASLALLGPADHVLDELTVADALAANAAAKRLAGRSAATMEILEWKRKALVSVLGAERKLRDVDVKAYAAKRMSEGAKGPTIKRELGELLFGWRALGAPKLPAMPELAGTNSPDRYLTAAELDRVLQHIPASRREHVLTYAYTGIRKSELYRITPEDVGAITVRVRGTKTEGAVRVVPMHDVIRPVLARRAATGRPGQPLFERWESGNADRDLRRAGIKAGVGPISFNTLRKTFATQLVLAGISSHHVASLLGHTDTRMVDRVYGRLRTGDHLVAAVAMLPTLSLKAGQPGRAGAQHCLVTSERHHASPDIPTSAPSEEAETPV